MLMCVNFGNDPISSLDISFILEGGVKIGIYPVFIKIFSIVFSFDCKFICVYDRVNEYIDTVKFFEKNADLDSRPDFFSKKFNKTAIIANTF